jgi:hypothetical protein
MPLQIIFFMKTKIRIQNALLGIVMAVFAVLFFSVLPAPSAKAEQPTAKPGFTLAPTPPTAEVDTVVTPPVDVPPDTPADPVQDIIDGMLSRWTLYVAGIVNLLVLLSGAFPKFTLFADDRKRDLLAKTLGAVAVAGLTVFTLGPGQIWPVLAGFAVAVFAYKNVIKVVAKTKTSAPPKVA